MNEKAIVTLTVGAVVLMASTFIFFTTRPVAQQPNKETVVVEQRMKPLTNDEIIAETKKCAAADMSARALYYSDDKLSRRAVYIQCEP